MASIVLEEILQGLDRLGLRKGDKVLVHSSLSRFGLVEGGAPTVIAALLGQVGPEGLVVVPTITGRAEHSPQNPPEFDPQSTPGWTGKIPETLRGMPQALRSLHPTHSVAAIGSGARELLSGHQYSFTPCGEESPYGRLVRGGGKVLLLGVGQTSNTTLHAAEEFAGVDYHLQPGPSLCRVRDQGQWVEIPLLLHQWGTPRAFERVDEWLRERDQLREERIGEAECRLMDSGALVETVIERLKRDPQALLA